jgi:putative N6-adenine-specific DNA methylase
MKDAHIDIRVTTTKSKLFHTDAVAERVQAAIYESLGRDEEVPKHKSNNDDANGNNLLSMDPDKKVRLTVRIVKDMVVMSIDTSYTPLHRRGYRLETAKAPLREDLAFALLMLSGWRPQYDGRQDLKFRGLLDPFCGSGTIVIEGASMVAGLPPGRLRPAPLGGTQLFDPLRWKTLLDDKVPLEPHSHVIICGSDRDAGAVSAAMSNAERAGVRELIDFRKAALRSNLWFEDPLRAPNYPLVVTNPPFGLRIKGKEGKGKDSRRDIHPLLPLYQTLGGRMNKLMEAKKGAAITVIAHDLKLARRMGLKCMRVAFSTDHGGINVAAMTSVVSKKVTTVQKVADLTSVLT